MPERKNKLKIVWNKIKFGIYGFLVTSVIGFITVRACNFIEKASELRKATEYGYSVQHKHYTQLNTYVVSQMRLNFVLNDLIYRLNKSGQLSEKDFQEIKSILEINKTQIFDLIRNQNKVTQEGK